MGAKSAGKLPDRSPPQQERVKLPLQGQLCTWRSTPAFKGNKAPVGAGGAESHGEEGAGLPASHDCVEEQARELSAPAGTNPPAVSGRDVSDTGGPGKGLVT